MRKDFFIGTILGVLVAFLGCVLFLKLATDLDLNIAYKYLKSNGKLGKLIALGALLNVGMVFLLFKKNKDMIAKGVIFSIFLLTLYTIFA